MISRRQSALFWLVMFLSFAGKSIGQVPTLYCEMYTNMSDFLDGTSEPLVSLGEVTSQSDRFVLFDKFKHPETGKKDKAAKYAWALILDSVPHLNLAFSNPLYQKMAFLQLDIVGRYCASAIHPDEKWLSWRSESLVSSGMIGKVIRESGGINFADTTGVPHRILVVDTEEIYTEPFSGNTGGMGVYLSYGKLVKMVKKTPKLNFEKDVYQLSFEEIMALLSKINQCHLEEKAN